MIPSSQLTPLVGQIVYKCVNVMTFTPMTSSFCPPALPGLAMPLVRTGY